MSVKLLILGEVNYGGPLKQGQIKIMNASLTRYEIKLFSKPATGIVEETITATVPGRVRFQATHWPARLYGQYNQVTLLPNDLVMVVGRQGLTLLVVPVN